MLRVVPVRSMTPSNISSFPTVKPSAGELVNPQQGFVSRPGGAFKFRALHQIPMPTPQINTANTSVWAPKNPYQVHDAVLDSFSFVLGGATLQFSVTRRTS